MIVVRRGRRPLVHEVRLSPENDVWLFFFQEDELKTREEQFFIFFSKAKVNIFRSSTNTIWQVRYSRVHCFVIYVLLSFPRFARTGARAPRLRGKHLKIRHVSTIRSIVVFSCAENVWVISNQEYLKTKYTYELS